ncbi:MAG: enoyl-CoA hydratase/isomerase family protein [Actinomycetota bacterium]|nr:enoyl-CoA hydratase/isomerase family protein [Actinomycetota bacterium]
MNDVLVQHGEVTTITINRPDKANALTLETTKAISDAVMAARGCRVIILTGKGKTFSAGGDFAELKRLSQTDPAKAAEHLYEGFQQMIRSIRQVPVPVIAAINGHAMGAGMDLALACDLRVISSQAKLGQVWVKVGIIPGTGGAFWCSLLAGFTRASQMILTGEPIDANTALEWGLVNEVTAPDQVMASARALASKILGNPAGAVAANKAALNEVIMPAYEAALTNARKVQQERFASDEFKQALAARDG